MCALKRAAPEPADDITSYYLQLTKTYTATYGPKTVVLLQCGAFFEIYGLRRPDGDFAGSPITDVCQLCNLNISEKKIVVDGCPVVMAGFRDYTLEKYLQRLADSGYTAVIYVQEKSAGGKVERRVLKEIISPGTYLSYDMEEGISQNTNHILCLWVEYIYVKRGSIKEKRMMYGAAVIHMFTGKSAVFEQETDAQISPTSLDELERFVSVHSPSEVIFLHSLANEAEVGAVLQYAGVRTDKIHILDVNASIANVPIINVTKQSYIKHILEERFGVDTYAVCAEFHTWPLATQSFCYLLHFIQEHNPHLVERISVPTFQNTLSSVLLANHTLKQLNILDDASADGKRAGHLSSVFAFINKCCTVMGRRKLYMQITHPIFDAEKLNAEYDMIGYLLEPENSWAVDFLRKQLPAIRDMERFCRNLLVGKVAPSALYQFYQNITTIHQINECFAEHPQLCAYFCRDISQREGINGLPFEYIRDTATGLLKFLDSKLVVDTCKSLTSASTEEPFLAPNVSAEYDGWVDTYRREMLKFNTIHQYLNAIMQRGSLTTDTTEYIKIHETDKSGYSLQITKKRAGVLKPIIAELAKTGMAKCPVEGCDITIDFQDARMVAASGSAEEIQFRELTAILQSIQRAREAISSCQTKLFADILKLFVEDWFQPMEHIASSVANMDTLQSKAYMAKTYHYCRPTIDMTAAKSFVSVEGLRHCLIEHLNTTEAYVANDVSLGKSVSENNGAETDGILLYGTNAVGKTSFIRALGIAVILAQSGCYVPCSAFRYKPYTAIFSRILGNDNIFKGLSTFAVEMSELRLILKMADENSLILGDELCSGTETESALAIFMSGLLQLHEARSSFLFATHFHEILRFDEMSEMPRLQCMHMAVEYNRELDCLIYDRRLRPGAGNRMYGLEVCQSLHLPKEFLEKAYALRAKYYPDTRGALSAPTSAKYSAAKVRGKCEMCGEVAGTETHHLSPQESADADGYIGGMHKNHPANLASVCEKCHLSIHAKQSTTATKKKTTRGKMIIS